MSHKTGTVKGQYRKTKHRTAAELREEALDQHYRSLGCRTQRDAFNLALGRRPRGRPREADRIVDTGITDEMFDKDGFVLPQFREHVAALRKRPEMWDLSEVAHASTVRSERAD